METASISEAKLANKRYPFWSKPVSRKYGLPTKKNGYIIHTASAQQYSLAVI